MDMKSVFTLSYYYNSKFHLFHFVSFLQLTRNGWFEKDFFFRSSNRKIQDNLKKNVVQMVNVSYFQI